MSVAIEIVPFSDSLDMYGTPDPSSAYSLSGHVSVSVTSSCSLFEHRRTARLLLQSVTLTFEGQNEVIASEIGYSAIRLCSVTRKISPTEPVELSNEGHEESDEPCVWNVVFNIPIPGWLPATTAYGAEDIGIRYSLFAEAEFINLNDDKNNAWSFATLCTPFRSRVKSVDAQKHIVLRRFASRSEENPGSSTASVLTYLMNPAVTEKPASVPLQFPPDVLSKIQVLATVPDNVDVESDHFPVIVRMRTKDLPAADCRKIQVASIATNLIQREKCRRHASPEYMRRYPVPPASQQPPNLPLRDGHPVGAVYDVGLYSFSGCEDSISRCFSLLPPEESTSRSLGDANYPFVDDADSSEPPTWYTMETSLPFLQRVHNDKSTGWPRPRIIHPSVSSPLLSVQHEVLIDVVCTYDIPGSEEPAQERLSFCVPVQFTRFAPALSSPSSIQDASVVPSVPPLIPYAHISLPAYSQLFDRNGDRKIDYSTPLPLYTRSSASTSQSLLAIDAEKQPDDSFVSSAEVHL